MDESDTTGRMPNEKRRAPIWLVLVCLLSLSGMIAVFVAQFIDLYPLVEPVGWAVFLGTQLLFILNAIFRKKRSDRMGEFHAQNMISWLVFTMLGAGLLLLVGLFFRGSAALSGGDFSIKEMYGLLKWLVVIFGMGISFGLVQWVLKKR